MPDFTAMAWLAQPDERRGIRFAGNAGTWERMSYADLAVRVAEATGAFRAAGIGRGWRVGLIYPTGPDFITALLGLWGLGATPCPIAPPGLLRGSAYADHVAALSAAAGLRAAAVAAECAATVTEALAPAGVPVLTDLRGTSVDPDLGGPDSAALIQFSSGSTARPKGIVISAGALSGHAAAIARWLAPNPEDTSSASWVPLHHDMGLIGCLVTPMTLSADIWLMRPEQFLRHPSQWLSCFGRSGVRFSAAPSWGLSYTVRRVSPEHLEGMDFSRWQALVVGAERVDPNAIHGFERLLAPYGFRSRAIVPAYGLAEATLAVTGDDLGTAPKSRRVDADQLAFGHRVPDARTGAGAGAVEIVSCGVPLPGTSVRILDDAGGELPACHLGEIEVSGATLATGYAEHGSATAFNGVLRTGDAGFVAGGELYVIGRVGDSLNIRGQLVFAEDLEQVLNQHLPDLGNPVVLLGARATGEVAVVLTERADGEQAAQAARALLPYLPSTAVEIWRTPRHAIARTTSGKPRRQRMWQALERRVLTGQQLYPPTI